MARPSDAFTETVLGIVDAIPPGEAMSYSDVAATFGSRAARGVGQVMALSGGQVPWWRVVRASGHPAPGHEEAALTHYRAEGTPLMWSRDGTTFRVDLSRARHIPPLA